LSSRMLLLALEIIIDLPIGFPINNIISLSHVAGGSIWQQDPRRCYGSLCNVSPFASGLSIVHVELGNMHCIP